MPWAARRADTFGVRPLAAQLRIELTLALRRGESVLITLVVPVVLLIFFGAVAASPPDFLVPGLLALAVMSTSMVSLGIATAYERYYGALKRLLGSPLPRLSLLAAKTLAVLAIEAVQIVLLVTIARAAFGWSPTGSPAAALAALVLGSAAFAGLGLLLLSAGGFVDDAVFCAAALAAIDRLAMPVSDIGGVAVALLANEWIVERHGASSRYGKRHTISYDRMRQNRPLGASRRQRIVCDLAHFKAIGIVLSFWGEGCWRGTGRA